jgi:hypothetical protein
MSGSNHDSGEFRQELERVLSSATLRSSDHLRRLLGYIGYKSLAGEDGGLKEFTIGVEAFGKPADYDPQADPTVWVLASKLRHKLDEYYRTEGTGDAVRIELPKGHYRVIFRVAEAQAAPVPQDSAAQVRRLRRACSLLALGFAAALLLALYRHGAAGRNPVISASGGSAWTRELELIWRPYLTGRRRILITLGTPLFTKFSGGFFRDPRLNTWAEAEPSDRLKSVQKALGSPYASPWHNFTGVGEATASFLLCKLLLTRTAGLSLKRSAAFSWEDLVAHNVVFLGSPKFNPQLKDIPFEEDFVIEGGSLRNLRPRPGEPAKFPEIWTPSHAALLEDHALITRIPGSQGRGEIMVLAASSTEGTWAAAQFVTDPLHARDLIAKLRGAPGELPEAYQVVIRGRFKDQVPIDTSYVTHRVLKAIPQTLGIAQNNSPFLRGTQTSWISRRPRAGG